MKLVWMFCFFLVGKLSAATPGDERAAAEANLGSGYMMAFPMSDEEQLAEESAEAVVKTLAESLVSDDDDDDDDDDQPEQSIPEQDDKEPVLVLEVEEKKEGDDQNEASTGEEPMGILQAQLEAEEGEQKPSSRRSLFKRPKIEELRKILGFPSAESEAQKAKPVPQEKPKAFQSLFNKPKPKPKTESPLGGLQFSLPLRREDRMRPFGFPILPLNPLKRDEGIRPFGLPDLVQAASSIIRRAIMDDSDVNDINKDDKDEDESMRNDDSDNEEEDDDDEDSVMIVPIPEGKDGAEERLPLFRRFPIPIPFPVPRPMSANRPRFPVPPLTPVAFFLPLAQQLMQNIIPRPSSPRSHPPLIPLSPLQHLMPMQQQQPMQNPMHMQQQQSMQNLIHMQQQQQQPMQNFMHIQQQPMQNMHIQQQPMQNLIPIQTQIPFLPIQQHIVPLHPPMVHFQQPFHQLVPIHTPFLHLQQPTVQIPFLTPLPPNMHRPLVRPMQMQRRIPLPPPPPPMPRRLPMPNPMGRMAGPQPHPMHAAPPQLMNHMVRRPVVAANTRPMPRLVRPPLPPVHPVLLMMSPAGQFPMHVPIMQQQQQQQQQGPIFHPPQNMPFIHQQVPIMHRPMPVHMPEEDRIIFVRSEPEEQDDDQEVLVLVPTDEVEMAQRPPLLMQRPIMRPVHPSMVSPLQRIRLLREMLMARQANRQVVQQPMNPQSRAARVVEIVQQQLRIFPAQHQRGQPMQAHPSRADASELHPVYVPFPGPQ